MSGPESIFLDCIDEGGRVDADRFREACDKHPELAAGMLDLRERFARGLRALGPSASNDGLGPTELLQHLDRDGRDMRRFGDGSQIGQGGMGVVLRVWDPELRRTVALKRLRRHRLDAPGSIAARARLRLLEEAQVLGQLQHPGIVPIFEIGKDEDADLFFTMPLVAGDTFAHVIDHVRGGSSDWSLPRAVDTLIRVCEAVAHAHSRGVLHRDLKPQNVMVGPYGETYVMDWGLAKIRGELVQQEASDQGSSSEQAITSTRNDLASEEPASPLLSMEGEVVGTPAYMSPEQARGRIQDVDERSDVFSIGGMLYHLLCGEPPYGREESDRRRLVEQVLEGPPDPVSEQGGEVPEELAAICTKAMARVPGQRYASVVDLRDDLRAHLEGRVVHAHARGPWIELWKWTNRHKLVVSLLSAVALVVAGSAIGFGILYKASERQRLATQTAQADALRRLSSLRGMAPLTTPFPSFHEEFDDGRLDRRWVVMQGHERVVEVDGALSIEAGPASAGATVVALDPFVGVLTDDFEVTVSYRLDGFDIPQVVRGERIASVELFEPQENRLVATLSRNAECSPLACDGAEQTIRTEVNASVQRCVSMEGERGRFRFTRSEGRLEAAFEENGAWSPLFATTSESGPQALRFYCVNWYVDEPFRLLIDNVDVRVERRNSRQALDSFTLQRTKGAIDSRLRVLSDAGVVAAIDGVLHLEKLPDRRGYVLVDLDPTRWELRGDFEISLAFELPRFPVPESGAVFLSLRLQSGDTHFGTIELHQGLTESKYKALHHVASATESTEDRDGRLRLRKRGSTLNFDYWNGGWRTLLVREHLDADLGFQFRVELSAPDSLKSYVAIVSDLEATSLSPRR
jgi:serine/threonine protein kinase